LKEVRVPPPLAADGTTVVFVGEFRPVWISPAWLHDHGQISDAELAKVQFELFIPNEATIFKVGWVRCVGNAQQLQFETQQEAEFERLRDLAVAVLRAMPDLELSMMGINRIVHFEVPSLDAWHAVGDNLVRNDLMNNVLHLSGMRSVTFWGTRQDMYGGRIQVQVEPSFQFPRSVFVTYNDHYDLSVVDRQPADREELTELARNEDTSRSKEKTANAVSILSNQWEQSMRRFNNILETVWRTAVAGDA
jgi:hypothetical protein